MFLSKRKVRTILSPESSLGNLIGGSDIGTPRSTFCLFLTLIGLANSQSISLECGNVILKPGSVLYLQRSLTDC
jgi:hypothetical protein